MRQLHDASEAGRNMFVERKLNPSTGGIELRWCDWEKGSMSGGKKVYINKIADEAVAVGIPMDSVTEEPAMRTAAPMRREQPQSMSYPL